MNTKLVLILLSASLLTISSQSWSQDFDLSTILERLEKLENENKELREKYQALAASVNQVAQASNSMASASTTKSSADGVIQFNSEYGYQLLDPLVNINRKQLGVLNAKQDGTLGKNVVNLQGAVTAIADYQSTNEPNLFGYLMRHPTSNNQRGTTVSEATIHSAQLGFTATAGDWITANAEFLFDPEQSFGAGTNTSLTRNQVQVRRAYVLFGNLDESPLYASLGKMAVPFGLTDTVNPFTNSTVWHAFGGLANGATFGYTKDGLNVSAMAIQGGAQFRSANTPVEGTSVPSKLNNYAVNASYEFGSESDQSLLIGASYQRGTAYCQGFPITHFSQCEEPNGAYDVYAKWQSDNWTVKTEFAKTTDEWPGTFNPTIPQFAASKVSSMDFGVQYRDELFGKPAAYSFEFSNFEAGPAGAEWERQNQWVLGLAMHYAPNIKLFSELIKVEGYAPLNFLSGGHIPDRPDIPVSDASADSEILMLGVNAAF
ncbi:hypothetical protein [Arenicella xantha]|uniref:Porin n=1 Tax=Arenicella xantha TaxID=644221 RepID=A0A395JMQ7_9GAMM|nr:hypothetical protein [Arenicella xantha]RBP51715.1 hypothetical protein DFR28_1021148 [Arenicella xantha]